MSGGGRALPVIVVISALSLLVGVIYALRGGGGSTFSTGADSYSKSAIGHRGLVNLLEELAIPVQRSRVPPDALLPEDLLVVLCEPRPDRQADTLRARERWDAYSNYTYRMLVVLPEWDGLPHPRRPRWIGDRVQATDAASRFRDLARMPVSVVRTADSLQGWSMPADLPTPVVDTPQLLEPASSGDGWLEPVWACDQGILLARWHRYEAETFYVLSDPDLLNNAGLGRGANARLLVALLEAIGAPPGTVVMDETLHGHALPAAPGAALLRPPLLWVSLHLLLLAGLALWWANLRTGGPRRTARAGRDGKAFLVASTASLLVMSGHRGHLLARYLDHAVRAVARARHLPATGTVTDVAARLDRLAPAGAERPTDLCARIRGRTEKTLDAAGLLTAAREIHTWTREMLDGTRRPARDRRPAA
jgi:hypothetical protein